MSRSLFAAMLLVGTAGLLWLLWTLAWQALTSLPSKDQLETVTATVAEVVERQTAPPPATAPASADGGSNVRFIEEDGIVGVRVDGPLERAPAVVREEPEPPPPTDEPDRYKLVVIESAGLIDVRSHKIQLAHIEAPAATLSCERADGVAWPCGRRARTALRRLIRRRTIECHDLEDETPQDAPVRTATCTVGNVDLAEWLVENGWATPSGTAPDLWRTLHDAAKAGNLGLYARDGR